MSEGEKRERRRRSRWGEEPPVDEEAAKRLKITLAQAKEKALAVAQRIEDRIQSAAGGFNAAASVVFPVSDGKSHSGQKLSNKIFIPTDKPEVNFLGLLIGPRGATQKV